MGSTSKFIKDKGNSTLYPKNAIDEGTYFMVPNLACLFSID